MTRLTFKAFVPLMLTLQLGAQSPTAFHSLNEVPYEGFGPVQSSGVAPTRASDREARFSLAGVAEEIARQSLAGKHLCGADVSIPVVDAVAISSNKLYEAAAVRWLDAHPGNPVHSAIVSTDGNCLASEGALPDGKRILRILATSLAVSNQGFAVFEAIYVTGDRETQNASAHRGVFAGDRFVLELDPKKASQSDSVPGEYESADFHWDDEHNGLLTRQDNVLVSYPAAIAQLPNQPTPTALPPVQKPGQSAAPKTPTSPCAVLNGQQKPGKPSLLPKSIQDRLKQLKDQFPGACPPTGTQAQ